MGKKATKRKFNYEPNVPRCRICVHFQSEKTVMRDSLPALVSPAHCRLHKFNVEVYAVCDAWVGSNDGATLEVPNGKGEQTGAKAPVCSNEVFGTGDSMPDIAKRLIEAEDVMAAFEAMCEAATTQRELVRVSDALDEQYHTGNIGERAVDWHEVNRILFRRMFGENAVPNVNS